MLYQILDVAIPVVLYFGSYLLMFWFCWKIIECVIEMFL
jgi:hypothetical protein